MIQAQAKPNSYSDEAIEHLARRLKILLIDDLEFDEPFSFEFSQRVRRVFRDHREKALPIVARELETSGVRARWNEMLCSRRPEALANWIAPHAVGKVLDLLCGDGNLGDALEQRNVDITLVEREGDYAVDRTRHIGTFHILSELEASPSRIYDTVLMCTVLHHEMNPDKLLALGFQLARHRVILVENCLEESYPLDYQLIMDIVFNNCLNQTVLRSTARHRTPEGWVEAVQSFGEAVLMERKESMPGIPLSHHLLVADRNGA